MCHVSYQSTVKTTPKGPGYVIDTSGQTAPTEFREVVRGFDNKADSNATALAIQTEFLSLCSYYKPEQSIVTACEGRGVGKVMEDGTVAITVWPKEREKK
jgi:hypothetical protein